MKKTILISAIIISVIAAIIFGSILAGYVYRDMQVAKLERYVREADLADGWGESYVSGANFYLRNRDDVLDLIEIVKNLKLMLPQPNYSWEADAALHVGNIVIVTDSNSVVFGSHGYPTYQRKGGPDWPYPRPR